MNITVLVENTTCCHMKTAHGLSIYIESEKHNILFDLGDDETLFENAKVKNIDLSRVDIVVISHGHKDHGGALGEFLKINSKAKIYIQERAFLPHYSHRPTGVAYIGLEKELLNHPQIILLSGDYKIDEELELFVVENGKECLSSANLSLYEGEKVDNFRHEQNLIIKGMENVLILGCGHNGVVNIMNRAEKFNPQICIGGFHLTNPSAKRDESIELLDQIIVKLQKYNSTKFYTCHCTGKNVFNYLSQHMDNIFYISCGDELMCR